MSRPAHCIDCCAGNCLMVYNYTISKERKFIWRVRRVAVYIIYTTNTTSGEVLAIFTNNNNESQNGEENTVS